MEVAVLSGACVHLAADKGDVEGTLFSGPRHRSNMRTWCAFSYPGL
jgi:hypothetical protein